MARPPQTRPRDLGSALQIAISDLPGFDPGTGPGLHTHPYDETFLVEAGSATFTVGDDSLELAAGQVAVVPASTPHKFVSGDGLRLISIALTDHMVQENLAG